MKFFGVEMPERPEIMVVELEIEGSKNVFAVQLKSGEFFGQKWETCQCCGGQHVKKYPVFKTKKAAQKKIDQLAAGKV